MGLQEWFRPKPKILVGVDIGSSAVKIAALKANGGSYELEALGHQELPEDTIVDGAILSKIPVADAIEQIFKDEKIKKSSIATSISGHSVIVKKVTLPALSDKELDQSIRWEAEQYIPFDISDVNVDYQVIRRSPDSPKVEILLVAAKKEKITDYTSVVSMAGKKPAVVDVDAFALQNIYEMNYGAASDSVVALINIGASVITVNIIRGEEFLFTRDIALAGSQYNEFLQKELGLDFETAERYKRGAEPPADIREQVESTLASVSENLALEIEKTFDFFRTTTNAPDVAQVYISGGASRTAGLSERLQEALRLPVERLDPFKAIETGSRDTTQLQRSAPDFAVALGLALRRTRDR